MDSFDRVTRQGLAISNLFALELAISAALFALVLGWLIVALVRFRARPDDADQPTQTVGHRGLEIAWTATPALVLAGVFVLVIQTMHFVDASEPGATRLRVIGHQWWWEFRYPELNDVVTANEVYVPSDAPVAIELESADVIHSFFVPQFGWMRDAVPQHVNRLSVWVERPGTYEGACTQFCGLQHAWMRSRVTAVPREEFNAWVQQQSQLAVSPQPGSLAARGQQVFMENTCINCHAIRGTQATAAVGPDLTHMASRATLGGGVLDNTPDNMRAWVRDAPSEKPGVLMPNFRGLSDADLQALVEYLATLQ